MRLLKNLTVATLTIGFFVVAGILGNKMSEYTMQGEVVGYFEDEVFVKLSNGEEVAFFGDDYEVGEQVVLTIRNIGDDLDITNDEILEVKYLD